MEIRLAICYNINILSEIWKITIHEVEAMNNTTFKVAVSNLTSELAALLYIKSGIDFTHPAQVYVQINETCNSKCAMCDVWRGKNREELPAKVWMEGMHKLKEALGSFKICFAGGEVFLKEGMFDILEACHREGIAFGITTNGILLNKENTERYVSLEPFNVNISLDSLKSDVYEKIRGIPCLDTIKSNIEYLVNHKKETGSRMVITIKTVVNSLNLSELEDIARYVAASGMDGVTFDPIKKNRGYFLDREVEDFEIMYRMDKKCLSTAISGLKELKRAGYPILNSEHNMDQWMHYDDLTIRNVCKVPLKTLILDPDGDIRLCDYISTRIGNIQDKDLKAVLHSGAIKREKHNMVNCKNPCVYCTKRTLSDYFRLLRTYGR